MKHAVLRSLVGAIALTVGMASAHQPGAGPSGGPGMMGGQGPCMMGSYGMGHGMGPGMMGFGAGRALWMLDLDDTQRSALIRIHDELRKSHWELAGKMHDEMAKLRDAFGSSGKRDRAAISAALDRISALHRQRIESALDAADRVDKVLTDAQREQLRRLAPGWMMGGAQ
jgi:Spy/CpxP family protein refolding chaperone